MSYGLLGVWLRWLVAVLQALKLRASPEQQQIHRLMCSSTEKAQGVCMRAAVATTSSPVHMTAGRTEGHFDGCNRTCRRSLYLYVLCCNMKTPCFSLLLTLFDDLVRSMIFLLPAERWPLPCPVAESLPFWWPVPTCSSTSSAKEKKPTTVKNSSQNHGQLLEAGAVASNKDTS